MALACYPRDYRSVKPSGHRAGILRCPPQAFARCHVEPFVHGYRFQDATSFEAIRAARTAVSWFLSLLASRLPVLHTEDRRLKSVAAPDVGMESLRLDGLSVGDLLFWSKMGSEKGVKKADFVLGGQ